MCIQKYFIESCVNSSAFGKGHFTVELQSISFRLKNEKEKHVDNFTLILSIHSRTDVCSIVFFALVYNKLKGELYDTKA
jgi:hypothetical protein